MTTALRAWQRTLAATALLAAPPARAHLVETGFGAFYNGIVHVMLTLPDLLVVVALALLAGQCGKQASRWALLALPVAWLVGGIIGSMLPGGTVSGGKLWPVLTTLSFGVAGALVAFNGRLPVAPLAAFGVLVGLLHGYVNGASTAAGAASAELAGAITAIVCLFAILAAQITTVRAAWSRIAVRAAGSWVAAVSVLSLGWLVRPVV